MTHPNSAAVLDQITRDGTRHARYWQVYDAIAALGLCTVYDVMERLGLSNPNTVAPRICELIVDKRIEERGGRPVQVGRRVITVRLVRVRPKQSELF